MISILYSLTCFYLIKKKIMWRIKEWRKNRKESWKLDASKQLRECPIEEVGFKIHQWDALVSHVVLWLAEQHFVCFLKGQKFPFTILSFSSFYPFIYLYQHGIPHHRLHREKKIHQRVFHCRCWPRNRVWFFFLFYRYKDQAIPKETLDKLIKNIVLCPTAGNQQVCCCLT